MGPQSKRGHSLWCGSMKQVGEYIRAHGPEILDAWYERASRAASARGLERPELMNLLGIYLGALGDLAEDEERSAQRRRKLIEEHFAKRLLAGFDLVEITEEFAVLGRCIAERWAQEPPEARPDSADSARLFAELHEAINQITAMYASHQEEDAQAEKRWTRRLEAAVLKQRRIEDGNPEALLEALLDVVADASEADSVTLFVYDSDRSTLVARASRGIADEAVEHYGAQLGPASFAGQVAENEEQTVEMLDVQTTDLEISATLRASGVQAMLGVRLPARRGLLGVMTIGKRAPGPFSARARRRIEMLGDRLSLHLDNVALVAQLERHIAALQAERAMRERFVALLAHDLRSPLSAAKMLATMLERGAQTVGECREIAASIDVNIVRTDRMVRDLLDVARLHSGEVMSVHLEPVDLAGLVEGVVKELCVLHGERFACDVESGVVGRWDSEALRRALWNLAGNAVKYGARDTPITIRGERRGAQALLSVHNLGATLSPEAQAQLFEPFVQLATGQGGGWGLGLASVRACAEAHHGRVFVDSSSESGTRFTLELPLDPDA